MGNVECKQNRFSAGEVTPLLYGDREWPKYSMSLRTCKNWLPIAQGPLVRRPGTRVIANTKLDVPVRAAKFVFADNNTYVLEFGPGYIRFFKNGLPIGLPYEVTPTPYTAEMLPYLKFAQIGNTITITYGGQVPGVAAVVPYDLVHTTGADSPWSFNPTKLKSPQLTWGYAGSTLDFSVPNYSGAIHYGLGDRVRYANQSWVSIQDNHVGNAPVLGSLFWVLSIGGSTNTGGAATAGNPVDATHFAKTVQFAQTAVFMDSRGITYESNPALSAVITDALDPARPLKCRAISLATEIQTGTYTLLYYNIYRGQNGVWGYIGSLTAPLGTFFDKGDAPDFTQQPPAGTNPFAVPGYPAVVSHYDQRRVWADALGLPQSLFMSKIGDLYRYDKPVPGADTDALNVDLVADKLHQIRSLVPLRKLLAMTSQGEWTLSGAGAGAITRTSQDFRKQSDWGSSWVDPLVIGNGVLFNTAKNNMVRDFYPLNGGIYTDVWDGDDLSWQARHFMDGHTIVSWDFQSTPYGVVWAVRDDGVLLSITYDRRREVLAWAQHTTLNGFFEGVVVVPEPPEDAVYFIVRRTVNGVTHRYWERMNNVILPFYNGAQDERYGIYLDASPVGYGTGVQLRASWDGHNTSAVTMRLSGGGAYAAGDQVTCTASGNFRGGFGGPIAGWFTDDPGSSAVVFDPDGAAVVCSIVGRTSAFVVTVELQSSLTAAQIAQWTAGTTNWGDAIRTNGLTNALGFGDATPLRDYPVDSGVKDGTRGVAVLADGKFVVPTAWAAGIVTLAQPAVVIQLGLAYNSDVELLDAWHPNGEIRNRWKRTVRIGFEVAGFRGLYAGQDFDHLEEWDALTVADSYTLGLKTGYFAQIVSGDWNKDGRAVLRSFEALPGALLSVLREMEVGGT